MTVFLAVIPISNAQSGSDAIRQITAGLAGAIPARAPISIVFENRSILDAGSVADFRGKMQQAFADAGFSITESGTPVRVSISENPHGFLAIVQFGPKVVMAQWRPTLVSLPSSRPRIIATPLWSQSEPILDVLRSDAAMLVLEPARVVLYRRAGDSWKYDRAAAVSGSAPSPRDPRGRLTGSQDSFRVTTPGASCTGSVRADLSLNCGEPFENPWVTGRNVRHHQEHGDYYSSAELAGGAIAIAGMDRKVRIMADPHAASVVLDGLGSDIAAIRNSCGVEWLATQSGASYGDSINGMNATGAIATDPLPMSGAVTALSTAEQADEVTAVIYNSSVHRYEAFLLAIHCPE